MFFEFILAFIPYYYILRVVFFIFLMAPQTNGAATVYKMLISPFLKKHEIYDEDEGTMVIATELCALSEYRIYPGNGKLFIRRDGKPIFFGSSKAQSLTMQRKKPAKLVWTQAWRRLNKKGLAETSLKKRARRSNKVARAVVGISLDDIRKRASQKPEVRTAQRDAALKEVKARKTATKKSGRGSAGKKSGGPMTKIPKNVKGPKK